MEDSLKQQLKDVGYNGKFDLSSLIEACGDEFRNLTKDNEIWSTNFIQGSEYDYGETEGKTPEEAVAKLYIKLNKKK